MSEILLYGVIGSYVLNTYGVWIYTAFLICYTYAAWMCFKNIM